MPENESTDRIRLLPCKRNKLFLSLAAILTILCKGIRTQKAWRYSITVDSSFSVQRGLALHIPCRFTYDQRDLSRSEKIFAYWFKYPPYSSSCYLHYEVCKPVATNYQYPTVQHSAKDRFYLLGVPDQGDCSLVITDARIEDEGRYYLRIEGSRQLKYSFLPEMEHTLPHVHVIEPPQKVTITVNIEGAGYSGSGKERKEELNPVIAKEGNTVNLMCAADGRPTPNLSWMKENQKIGEPTPYLQLREIGPEDAGKYQCLANQQNRSTIKTMVELIVQYRPRMLVFNTTQTHRRGSILTQGCSKELSSVSEWTAEVGDSLELLCKADSNPPATTSWAKRDGRLQKPPDNQLRLTNLTVEDEGVYVCKAKNGLGNVEGTFRLYVTYAPKLSGNPQKNTTCYYHDNGFLCTCTLHAKPPPQIEWEVDGERITEESRRRGNWTVEVSVKMNEVTSTLNWTGSLDRAHNIICMGSNSYGIQSMQFLLNAKRDSTSESSIGKSNKALFIAGLCGIFLGAGIFMLCLFLIRVFKQKKAILEASHVEGISSGREPQEKPKNSSHIYSNVFPMGPRLSPADKPKPAGERKPKVPQVSTVPAPRRSEPPELQYAALNFKPKSKGVPDLSDDNMEYSPIQRK
ncbi:sialic acid-binding Ig-like lectin 5 [Pituophis catenifer annectens]|uniref:sialic acid-binding Ig-like lectin 5 n=1 Tax=Pituophis catenifer annectens TaxID=94852 RepID=UPI003993D146